MALNSQTQTYQEVVGVQVYHIPTVFPHIRPAGIIFLPGLKVQVLIECGY